MLHILKTALILAAFLSLTSCSRLEEPKIKDEIVSSPLEYEKVIDDLLGVETINPDQIRVGDQDTMVESLQISSALKRERFRRKLTVIDIQKSGIQTQYKFQVEYIQRDEQGNPQPPVTTLRTLVIYNTSEGYKFSGDGTEFTSFSWDKIYGIRGFCSNRNEPDEDFILIVSCTSIQVESAIYAPLNIPVRKLSLNRSFEIMDKATGSVEKGKFHYVIQIAPQIQEISKVLSFCVEGLQKLDNNVYQLTNCNSVESL